MYRRRQKRKETANLEELRKNMNEASLLRVASKLNQGFFCMLSAVIRYLTFSNSLKPEVFRVWQ